MGMQNSILQVWLTRIHLVLDLQPNANNIFYLEHIKGLQLLRMSLMYVPPVGYFHCCIICDIKPHKLHQIIFVRFMHGCLLI